MNWLTATFQWWGVGLIVFALILALNAKGDKYK